MLSTPFLRKINPFNAIEDYIFKFDYQYGNQASKNEIVIERVLDNLIVYSQIKDSFSLQHTLPANTLVNGTNYRVKVRVGDINSNWSEYSEYIFFWALESPSLTITTIDYANQNRVYNQTVNFETTYMHPNGELLQSYRYLLYDGNKNLINSFVEKFGDGSIPLSQEITSLENGISYYVEIKTQSVNGQQSSSGLINFIPFYIVPKLYSTLTTENLPKQGAVKLSANILQLILKVYDNNGNEISPSAVEYIDNDWIDMNRVDYDKLVAHDGFNIEESNFSLQLWCKNIPENEVFLTLYTAIGSIELKMYGNRIHAFKKINNSNISAHFASEEIIINWTDTVSIAIKQQEDLIDVFVSYV